MTVAAQTTTPPAAKPHPLAWSAAQGKPATLPVGQAAGFFVWHNGNTVCIATTDQSAAGQTFTGRIVVSNATITNPTGVKLEQGDGFTQPKPIVLLLKFNTHLGVDGIKFTITPVAATGTTPVRHFLRMNLQLAGQPTTNIFIGPNSTQATGDPVTFNLDK